MHQFNRHICLLGAQLLLLIFACAPSLAAIDRYYDYEVIKGSRLTCAGLIRRYDLYLPRAQVGQQGGPYPIVVLIHGYMRQAKHMRHNAEYLAQRGLAVFVPQMDQILLGYKRRGKNMDEVIDHVQWLVGRASDKDDQLFGVLDPKRLGTMGHSSGGPICLEVVIGLQKRGITVDSMCQVDAIVWRRTMAALPELKPLDVLSLRTEPAICNGHAGVFEMLDKLPGPYRDIKVNNSKHCDPENPTNFGCMCICGPSHDKYRQIFVRLLYVYFKDRLHPPPVPDSGPTLAETLGQFEVAHAVTRGKGWDEAPVRVAHPMDDGSDFQRRARPRNN